MKRYLILGIIACIGLGLSSCVGDDFVPKTPTPSGPAEGPPSVASPELPQEPPAAEAPPAAQAFAVKTIAVTPAAGDAVSVSFAYQDGKLVSVSRTAPDAMPQDNPIPTKEEFQYDANGRLAEIKRYYGDSISNPVLSEREAFEYDANGIVKKHTRFGGKDVAQTNIDDYTCKADGSCEIKSKVYDSKNKIWVDASGSSTITFDGNGLPASFLRIMGGPMKSHRMRANTYDEKGRIAMMAEVKEFPTASYKDTSWTWTAVRSSEDKITHMTRDFEATKPNCLVVQADSLTADGMIEKETLLKIEGQTCTGSTGGSAAVETHAFTYEALASKPVMPPIHMLKLVPKETLLLLDDAASVFGRGINPFAND